jgi:hypothetical protein
MMTHNFLASLRAGVPVVITLILALSACSGEIRPKVVSGIDACAGCNMIIDRVNQACGHVAEGEFIPFDSPGCLLRSHDELRRQGAEIPTEIFFADYQSGEFLPVDETVFLLTENQPTVMGAGVLCFATLDAAEGVRTEADEVISDWTGYRRLRATPDAIIEATITSDGLFPEIIEVAKNDLVLFKLHGDELADAVTVVVRGYPEIGEIEVTPTDEPTVVRFFANRPGMGFPILGLNDDALGMIRVTGAHTADEAAQ